MAGSPQECQALRQPSSSVQSDSHSLLLQATINLTSITIKFHFNFCSAVATKYNILMIYIYSVLHTLCRCSTLCNSKSCTSLIWIKDQTTLRTFHSTNSCKMVLNSMVFSLLQRWSWVTWTGLNWSAVLNSHHQLCFHVFMAQYLNMASKGLSSSLTTLWSEEIMEKWSLDTFLITFQIRTNLAELIWKWDFDFALTIWTLLKELPPRKKWKSFYWNPNSEKLIWGEKQQLQ